MPLAARCLVFRHRGFETQKRAFVSMATLQILAMPKRIAAVRAWPSG